MEQKIVNFTADVFTQDTTTGKLIYNITNETLGLGTRNVRVAKLYRKLPDSSFKPVVIDFTITSEGNLIIYSDLAFDGRLLVITDV